jgi:methylmalonyl-CoA/ethylmalonyl-CoA epimerase
MKAGKIGHIGIVVADINEAKERYSQLFGIKKWYELQYDDKIDLYYHGVKKDCEVTLYFGGKGHTTIELIQTRGEDNIYSEFLKRRGEGIHHFQYNVASLEKAVADMGKQGWKVIQNAVFHSAGARVEYAYVGASEDSPIVELIETTLPSGMKKGDVPFETQMAALTGNYKLVK